MLIEKKKLDPFNLLSYRLDMGESIFTLIMTTVVLLGTPGPAPIALATTSASFGFKNSLNFLYGILTGLTAVLALTALGLASLFAVFPSLKTVFIFISSLYLVYIAYKIASGPVSNAHKTEKIPSYKDGFILNLLNPKAYAAFAAIFSTYLLPFENNIFAISSTALICFTLGIVIDFGWVLFGALLTGLFSKPKFARAFRVTSGLLIISLMAYKLYS